MDVREWLISKLMKVQFLREYGSTEGLPTDHVERITRELEPTITKLIIERLGDWNYGAFLNETDAACIAIGATEEEARENGERELRRREEQS